MTKNPIIYKFFKDFTNHRKRTDSGVVFSSIPFPNILENKTLSDTFKRSVGMYESSGSQFFRTTNRIQSGPDAFDESRFVITFLIILKHAVPD